MLCFVGVGKYHYTMPDNPDIYDRSKLFVDPSIISKIMSLLSISGKLHSFSVDSFIYAHVEESEQSAVEHIFEELKQYEHDDMY